MKAIQKELVRMHLLCANEAMDKIGFNALKAVDEYSSGFYDEVVEIETRIASLIAKLKRIKTEELDA